MPRTLAIGDIHGCITALNLLLDMMQPTAGDTVIPLGDYVDRGPDSCAVLERLIGLGNICTLLPIRGNHDIMMLTARDMGGAYRRDWFNMVGGDATLASYGGSIDGVPSTHWAFLERTLPYVETTSHIFVHAGVDPELAMEDQTDDVLYWEKLRNPGPHISGKWVICGHTSQKNGIPLDLGHLLCIDTWVYGNGWLSGLDVASGRIYQANERGETRTLTTLDI